MTQKQKEQFNKAMLWRLGVDENLFNELNNKKEEEKLTLILEWKAFRQQRLNNLTSEINTIQSDIS